MAIFFKTQNPVASDMDRLYESVQLNLKEKFARRCDAILHGYTCDLFGYDDTVTDACRYLEQKGCYIPDFYMVNPFYYLGLNEPDVFAVIRNGAIFFRIDVGCDLDNFQIPVAAVVSAETMESLPVVLFREFDINVGTEDDCDDEDVVCKMRRLYPKRDNNAFPGVCKFIGVFKAELKTADEDSVVYKLTKVFERYYFDDTKIQTEIADSH